MKRETLNARELLLVVLGWAITILVIVGVTAFWRHNLRAAILSLVSAAALTYIFFWKRKFVFAIIALTFLLVNVGLTALFHPTWTGCLITAGSIGCLYLLFRWQLKNYPHLSRKDMHKLFDHDPE
jgi:hypothetical protein